MSTKHRSTLAYGGNPRKPNKTKGSFRKAVEARAEARKAAAAREARQVEVVGVGSDETPTRLEARVGRRGEWSRDLAAATFRIAARVAEESLGWGWSVRVDESSVIVELASGSAPEESAARAAIERALGSKGRPNPSAPNMSTLYTVEV